eukprot:scaffold8067_cov54-Phaeocystis_antarctica.AAC.1
MGAQPRRGHERDTNGPEVVLRRAPVEEDPEAAAAARQVVLVHHYDFNSPLRPHRPQLLREPLARLAKVRPVVEVQQKVRGHRACATLRLDGSAVDRDLKPASHARSQICCHRQRAWVVWRGVNHRARARQRHPFALQLARDENIDVVSLALERLPHKVAQGTQRLPPKVAQVTLARAAEHQLLRQQLEAHNLKALNTVPGDDVTFANPHSKDVKAQLVRALVVPDRLEGHVGGEVRCGVVHEGDRLALGHGAACLTQAVR